MSNDRSSPRFKCLFFGMPCAFSSPILTALDRRDIELVGVVTPQSAPDTEPFRVMRGVRSQSVISLTGHSGQFRAPRYHVRDINDHRLIASLTQLEPDLIVVACYPRLIPESITATARITALNIHPSLLPRHRGPDPLFWTFRAGETTSGVTLHLLSNKFDAGSILAQTETTIQPDESLAALEQRLARLGAKLLARLISNLPTLPVATPQRSDGTPAEAAPGHADREIDPAWSVVHSRRFIAGVGHSHGPLWYRGDGVVHRIIGLATSDSAIEITLRDGSLRVATSSPGGTELAATF